MKELLEQNFALLAKTTAEEITKAKKEAEDLKSLKVELLDRVLLAVAPFLPDLLGVDTKAPNIDPFVMVRTGAAILVGSCSSSTSLFLAFRLEGTEVRPVLIEKAIPTNADRGQMVAIKPNVRELTSGQAIGANWWPSAIFEAIANVLQTRQLAALENKLGLARLNDCIRLTLRIVWNQKETK